MTTTKTCPMRPPPFDAEKSKAALAAHCRRALILAEGAADLLAGIQRDLAAAPPGTFPLRVLTLIAEVQNHAAGILAEMGEAGQPCPLIRQRTPCCNPAEIVLIIQV